MVTNNVTRFLDSRKIPYTPYELPAEKIGALESARLIGVSPSLVYKTIVVVRERPAKPILAVVPGDHAVNLKSLAAFIGEKKLKIPSLREAEQLTGLQAGGISPLALLNKGFQVVVASEALQYEQIHISGGQRGLNIRLAVKALIELTHARTAAISDPLPEEEIGGEDY
ncbi:MAG TPA: YbaK/EbsC family protein [Bellilinea sp.]|nr:YbaK/EbsC family protein [Bellilinea sp.]